MARLGMREEEADRFGPGKLRPPETLRERKHSKIRSSAQKNMKAIKDRVESEGEVPANNYLSKQKGEMEAYDRSIGTARVDRSEPLLGRMCLSSF